MTSWKEDGMNRKRYTPEQIIGLPPTRKRGN